MYGKKKRNSNTGLEAKQQKILILKIFYYNFTILLTQIVVLADQWLWRPQWKEELALATSFQMNGDTPPRQQGPNKPKTSWVIVVILFQ